MIEENEENFDDEEYPRVKRKIDYFDDLIEPSFLKFRLEWKCNAPIIFFESK